MGIIVKSINKNGNKIIDYICESNGKLINLTREQLINQINDRKVDNARIQVYKGQIIIRIKQDEQGKITEKKERQTNKDKTVADLMKEVAKSFNVDYVEQYSNVFYETNPELKDKDMPDTEERVEITREIVRFWNMVALRQLEMKYNKWNEEIDNMDFKIYCLKNNLDSDEE